MQKLHVAVLFIFAALSMAWAQLPDFRVLANGSDITNPIQITYGDILTLSVSPRDGSFQWLISSSSTVIGTGYSYSPSISGNPATSITENYIVKRIEDGSTKNINVVFARRPVYTVSFNTDGGTPSTIQSQEVLKDSLAKEPTGTLTKAGHKFEYWKLNGTRFNFNTPITQTITLTAQWTPIKYKITWKFENGSQDKNDSIPYGTPLTPPANPTKPSTVQYEYNFSGWNPVPSTVTGDQTYTATYTETIRKYTITWMVDGTTYKTDPNINYGTNAQALIPSTPPTKASTVQYDYTFTGWSPTPGTITGNTTYTAQFNQTLRKYIITWNVEGTITTNEVSYGTIPVYSGTPQKASTLYDTYTFTGWSPTVSSVSGPATYTALFSSADREYTVTLYPQGGTVSPSTVKAKYNQPIASLLTPTRAGYAFNGWFTAQSGGIEYNKLAPNYLDTTIKTLYAQWSIIPYTITYNYKDGTPIPPLILSYNIESGPISLPSMQERCGWVFDGWLDNPNLSGVPALSFTPNANNLGNKNFYEKWTSGLMTPNANLLNYNIPNLIYSGQAIAPIAVSPKTENQCALGSITVLYNGTGTLPKDAGTYAISASIAENTSYKAATVPLGNLVIGKKAVTMNVLSATAEDKSYDATTAAKITSIDFSPAPALLGSDQVSKSDYSIAANFASPNIGENIEVNLVVNWLSNGPLSKNYILESVSFKTTASITKAIGFLQIKAPEKYELSDSVRLSAKLSANKPSFVRDEDIIWEYKREGDAGYSKYPNRVGNWQVRATLPETNNYTGAADSIPFLVERGSAPVPLDIKLFKESNFERDPDSSDKQRHRHYYVAKECNVDSAEIQITIRELDIILKLNPIPDSIPYYTPPECGPDGNDILCKIPIKFGKPGLYPLLYTLFSEDGRYTEEHTVLIETPIPFDSITGQKWNNVLFINNNPETNGHYKFENYQWFQIQNENEKLVSETQFYSAGPSSKDILNPKDIYKVTMHTTDGMRISTCKGSPKIKAPASAAKPTLTKQVLGINGKTAKTGSKVYNLKGSKTENTPAGVYIIEE